MCQRREIPNDKQRGVFILGPRKQNPHNPKVCCNDTKSEEKYEGIDCHILPINAVSIKREENSTTTRNVEHYVY